MAFFNRVARSIGTDRLLRMLRIYPPYAGAGVVVRSIDRDVTAIEVQMKLRFFNRNFVGTHFGGSLYSMCDPWFMLMLMHHLGDEYVVWDKSATIDFLKPGRGTVRARFEMPAERVAALKAEVDERGKINPRFEVVVTDAAGEPVARVTKLLSVRRKDAGSPVAA